MIREVMARLHAELPPEAHRERCEYFMHPVAIAALFRELRDDLDQPSVGADGGIWFFGHRVREDVGRNPEHIELREV